MNSNKYKVDHDIAKKISEKQILVSDESKNSNFFDNNGISSKPLSRGWYDIASLNLR